MLGAVPLLDVGLHRPIKRRVVPGQVLKPISGVVFSRVIIAAIIAAAGWLRRGEGWLRRRVP